MNQSGYRVYLGLLAGLLAGCGASNTSTLSVAQVTNPLQTTTTTASVVPATSLSPLVTSTPTTYTGSALTTYKSVGSDRSNMGVGLLVESPALDIAAQAHAAYLAAQTPPVETHTEISTAKGFYADTPYDRAIKAGFTPTSAWIDEAIGDVNNCFGQLMSSVYHLQELTSNVQEFGIGMVSSWACVMEFATVTGTANLNVPTNGAGIPSTGGQQIPAGTVAVYPYNGQTAVPGAMSLGEKPSPPLPSGYTAPGHPLLMRTSVSSTTQVLTVTSFSLTDGNNNAITGVLLLSPASATASTGLPAASSTVVSGSTAPVVSSVSDPNIMQAVAVFVPQTILVSGMTYKASFVGSMSGTATSGSSTGSTALSYTWSFTVQ